MLFLSVAVGAACGAAAALLIYLLTASSKLFFGHVQPGTSLWVIGIPALGGLIVGPLTTRFAPESKGHGVPEVMLAIAQKEGRIRPRVAVVKAIASAVTIGSGGSAGREGPIVQIGAAIGSFVGQIRGESADMMKMLVACGAASGIAASFNAPIAGVVFALEVILRDFKGRAFAMVVAAAVASSVLTRTLLGRDAFFHVPPYELHSATEILFYVVLGVVAAWAARLFISVLYAFEDAFEAMKVPVWIKPAIGGLLIGVLGYYVPDVFGTGHAPVEKALAGTFAWQMLAVLFVGKLLATSFTLGSGGSGGVFAPSLFMGAMVGGIVGLAAARLLPGVSGPVGAYALVGMGAVFAGSSFAPMTAILIISEMTHDYALVVPLMAACGTSYLVSHAVSPESVYTLKLARRGIHLDAPSPQTALALMRVDAVMSKDVDVLNDTMSLPALIQRVRTSKHSGFPVVDDAGHLVGVLTHFELRTILEGGYDPSAATARSLMRVSPPVAKPSERVSTVMERMKAYEIDRLPVIADDGSGRVVGVVTEHDLVNILLVESSPPVVSVPHDAKWFV